MTTNVCNRGIAHMAHRYGGAKFCKSRRGHIVVTPADRMGYQVCKRCERAFEKMQAVSARVAAKKASTP